MHKRIRTLFSPITDQPEEVIEAVITVCRQTKGPVEKIRDAAITLVAQAALRDPSAIIKDVASSAGAAAMELISANKMPDVVHSHSYHMGIAVNRLRSALKGSPDDKGTARTRKDLSRNIRGMSR